MSKQLERMESSAADAQLLAAAILWQNLDPELQTAIRRLEAGSDLEDERRINALWVSIAEILKILLNTDDISEFISV